MLEFGVSGWRPFVLATPAESVVKNSCGLCGNGQSWNCDSEFTDGDAVARHSSSCIIQHKLHAPACLSAVIPLNVFRDRYPNTKRLSR